MLLKVKSCNWIWDSPTSSPFKTCLSLTELPDKVHYSALAPDKNHRTIRRRLIKWHPTYFSRFLLQKSVIGYSQLLFGNCWKKAFFVVGAKLLICDILFFAVEIRHLFGLPNSKMAKSQFDKYHDNDTNFFYPSLALSLSLSLSYFCLFLDNQAVCQIYYHGSAWLRVKNS